MARLAGELVARGAVPGDRIAVLARNSVLQVALHFACGRAGFIYAPLNWRLGVAEIALLLELAEPRLLFADERSADLLNGTPFIPLSDVEQSAAGRAPFDGPMLDPDHPSLLLFTSGTSGKPKGVILTERNLHETAVNFGMLTRIGFDSVFLCDAPMFHVIGLVTNIRPVMTQGGAIAVSDGFEVARTLARLSDPALGITHYVGVPQMIAALRQQPGFDFSALRGMTALVSGGAPHPPEDILAWIADGVPIVLGFGMSEAGTVFGMSVDLDVIGRKPGSAGLATPMVETRIVDLEGRDVAPGQPGELLLRGENVSPGYWRNPEETARTRDAEGWFATGDIARCDEDGFFWIVDRRKDMFISGGENIYPAEIEALLDKYSGIAQCAVVGMPDAPLGRGRPSGDRGARRRQRGRNRAAGIPGHAIGALQAAQARNVRAGATEDRDRQAAKSSAARTIAESRTLKPPVLGALDQEVAERRHPLGLAQRVGIDQMHVEADGRHFRHHRHQAGMIGGDIVRHHADAQPAFHRLQNAGHIPLLPGLKCLR